MLERRTFICHRITAGDIDAYLLNSANVLVKEGYSADAVRIQLTALRANLIVAARIHGEAHNRYDRSRKARRRDVRLIKKRRDGVYENNARLPKGLQKPHNE